MKGKRGLLLIVVAVVLVGGGFGVFKILGRGGGESTEAAAAPRVVETVEVGQFVTNLNDPVCDRYIQVTVQLEVEGTAAVSALSERHADVRDRILGVLRSSQYEDLLGAQGMTDLASQIRSSLSAVVPEQQLLNVFFTDFIVQ